MDITLHGDDFTSEELDQLIAITDRFHLVASKPTTIKYITQKARCMTTIAFEHCDLSVIQFQEECRRSIEIDQCINVGQITGLIPTSCSISLPFAGRLPKGFLSRCFTIVIEARQTGYSEHIDSGLKIPLETFFDWREICQPFSLWVRRVSLTGEDLTSILSTNPQYLYIYECALRVEPRHECVLPNAPGIENCAVDLLMQGGTHPPASFAAQLIMALPNCNHLEIRTSLDLTQGLTESIASSNNLTSLNIVLGEISAEAVVCPNLTTLDFIDHHDIRRKLPRLREIFPNAVIEYGYFDDAADGDYHFADGVEP